MFRWLTFRRGKLPKDDGYGKVFWVVVGTVTAAVVGIPLTYIIGLLTPKASFDILEPKLSLYPTSLHIGVHNTSKWGSAKDVLIAINVSSTDLRDYNLRDGDRPAPIVDGDSKCERLNPAAELVGFTTSFKCHLVNGGDRRFFMVRGAPSQVRISIEYENYTFVARFAAQRESGYNAKYLRVP